MRNHRNPWSVLAGLQNGAATLEESFMLSYQTKPILSPCDPANVLLGIYPKELKTYVHTKTHTWMFLQVLSIIAKTLEVTKMSFSR